MALNVETLKLIDLIHSCHRHLRQTLEHTWSEHGDVYISNSEWLILSMIKQEEQTTQSYLSKEINITRQATHKFIKNLEDKQLIERMPSASNKREKAIKLTPLGMTHLKENERIKQELEEKIAETIGKDQIHHLKELLAIDWGI